MFKKTLISFLTIIFALIIFNNSIFAYTQEEIEEAKNKAEELLKAEINNSEEEIKNYYNSLMQTKEKLNQMILETEEKEELQKLKYSINITIMQLEEVVKVNLLESEISKYIGYVPTLLGVNLDTSKSKVDVEVIPKYTGSKISGAIAFNGGGQYGVTLKNRAELFCQDHGGSLTSVSKSEANVDDGEDGTLYVTGNAGTFKFPYFTDYVGQRTARWAEDLSGTFIQLDRRIRQDEYGFFSLSERYHILEPDSVWSYGDWKCTRSIARFSASKADLKEGQSYILGYSEDNTGSYPSYVQQAYWIYQENSGETQIDIEAGGLINNSSGYAEDADGAGSRITNEARQLAAEALKIEEERLTPLGTEVENTTNMEECTVVYNLDEHCWYAGPFTLNYERKTLKTIAGATSKVEQGQNELLENKIEGLVEYRGINDIKYYDEGGNELQGVEFVIPNKTERQVGDEEYKFPYPEEEFYLKIPYEGNEDAEEFKEMEVQLFDMYSEGEGYDLDGTYYKLRWEGRKYAILCTDPGSCSRHEGQEVGHEIRVAGSCDSSCPDDCSSSHYTWEPCSGYAKCYIHNGRVSISHLQRWDHYLAAADSLDGPFDAQDLLNVTEAKIGMLFVPATLSMEKTLTMRMGGTVYNDLHSGKETDQNGIKDANEQGIKGVKVTITPITEEGEARQTYTDANGKWSIPDAKVGKYDVEFEYDGQTYKTTKYLASGNLKNLNDSKAKEVEGERQAFNDKFYEITETLEGTGQLTTGTAVGTKGQRSGLNYATQNRVSKIITRDASTNIPLDLYKMQARTSSTDLYYPIDDLFHIEEYNKNAPGGSYIATYPYLENINLGLIERAKADFALLTDISVATVTIKDKYRTHTFNSREPQENEFLLNDIDDLSYRNDEYFNMYCEQEITKADYNWRYDGYKEENTEFTLIDELQVFVTYKIIIRNQSPKYSGYITELIDYYDEDYEYSNEPYRDFVYNSWIQKNDEESIKLDWTTKSKYGKTSQNCLYTTGLENTIIEPGQKIEIYIAFKVSKDQNRNMFMDADNGKAEGKENKVEINAYRTVYNGKVEGKIDTDSNPGNNIKRDITTYEDDIDRAQFFKLIWDRDEGEGNVIKGVVWEDLKLVDENGEPVISKNHRGQDVIRSFIKENNQIFSNGYKESDEPFINNIKVELVEIKDGEELHPTTANFAPQRTGQNGLNDGEYKFTNLPQGNYRVIFTYGDEYQLTAKDYTTNNQKIKSDKYNAQDYMSTIYNGKLAEVQECEPVEVTILIDTSGSMCRYGNAMFAPWSYGATKCRHDYVYESTLNLIENLYDTYEGIKIGLVFFSDADIPYPSTTTYPSGVKVANQTGTWVETGAKVISPLTSEKDRLIQLYKNTPRRNCGNDLAAGIQKALPLYSQNNENKIMFIFTDGYMERVAADKAALVRAENEGIKVVSVISADDNSTRQVFGTEENPTAGKTYYIQDSEISDTIKETVFDDIAEYTNIVLPNKSYAIDEQITSTSGELTYYGRKENIEYSEIITNSNGVVLDVPESSDLKELAEETLMTARTVEIPVKVNKGKTRYIEEVNLGLVERPKVEIKTEEEIVGIQLILSDGTLLIDTENGLSNYVTAPNRKGVDKTISIDNELQQGSTIKIKYKITIKNTGEVDTYGSYFAYDLENPTQVQEYEETIPTSASIVYAYVNQNMAFRQEENNQWKVVTDTSILSQDVKKDIKAQKCTVIETKALSEPLYPEISKEVKNGEKPSSIETTLILSKVISSQDSTDTLTYNNSIEIVQRYNKVGRRDYIGVPGNYKPNSNIVEYDSAKAETVIIIPPFGEQRIYYMLTAIIISIIALSVVLIKKYVIGKKQN